jgi:putative flippase GtrA
MRSHASAAAVSQLTPMPAVHPMVWRLFRFGIVGVTVMVVFMGLNWVFGHWFGKDASFLLAYPPAVALHFWLNKTWTFGSSRTDSVRQVSEYLVMVLVTFAVQAAVFKGLTATTNLPGWAAAGISNVAQMALTFLAMQFRVFTAARTPE